MKKLKFIVFTCVVLFMNGFCFSQSLTPSVIASSGAYFLQGNNSLSWTMGESFTETFNPSGNYLTQVFWQIGLIISDLKWKN